MNRTRSETSIEWLNHAAFIVRHGDVSIACDPWLTGTAFNKGWRHVSDSAFRPEDFASVSHIWFSHQHPDHFAPNDLKRIPAEIRSKITTLYHRTIDKKVIRFCASLNFGQQIELSGHQWLRLSNDVAIKCGVWLDRDSWLAIATPSGTILNANDCVIDSRPLARQISKVVGPVTTLLTQFSYAEYQGPPENRQQRIDSAYEKLRRIAAQVEVFQPRYVVPFASFVYWCHPENFHMNAEMNRIGSTARFIESALQKTPIVLYPGESWPIGESRSWENSAKRYDSDLDARLAAGPTESPTTVPIETLKKTADNFTARVRKNNPLLFLFPTRSTTVYLRDLRTCVELTREGLRELPGTRSADIEMHSESLSFCLKAPWGANALNVNGRFSPGSGSYTRFFSFFKPADWSDHGYTLSLERMPLLLTAAWARVIAAVGRRLDRRFTVPTERPAPAEGQRTATAMTID